MNKFLSFIGRNNDILYSILIYDGNRYYRRTWLYTKAARQARRTSEEAGTSNYRRKEQMKKNGKLLSKNDLFGSGKEKLVESQGTLTTTDLRTECNKMTKDQREKAWDHAMAIVYDKPLRNEEVLKKKNRLLMKALNLAIKELEKPWIYATLENIKRLKEKALKLEVIK